MGIKIHAALPGLTDNKHSLTMVLYTKYTPKITSHRKEEVVIYDKNEQ
jgi:hypothetical protein